MFDRVCDLLTELGYLPGTRSPRTDGGSKRIYAESDLLVAECLREGVWAGLDGPAWPRCASAIVYQARRDDAGLSPRMPPGTPGSALDETVRLWSALEDAEHAHALEVTPQPDLGPCVGRAPVGGGRAARDRALGRRPRRGRLRALVQAGHGPAGPDRAGGRGGRGRCGVRRAAKDAIDAVRRGVVAYSSVV